MKQRVRCETTKGLPNDPHQMLLSELGRQDREEASRVDLIGGRPIDQRLGASDAYIILDSTQRNVVNSNPDKGVFSFDIRSEGTTGDQKIGVTNPIINVTEIEMQSFPMPNIPTYTYPVNPVSNNAMPVLIPNPGPMGLVFNQLLTNRFMIQIDETSVQSFSDSGGVRHNFEFDVVDVRGQLYASPVSPVYVFTDPITSFDRLTLTFRNPPKNISFAEDTMAGARLAIHVPLVTYDPVVGHITQQIDGIAGFAYDGVAGTIVTQTDGVVVFTNPMPGTSIDADDSTINIGNRVLFSNVGGVGADVANGVYTLTSVGGGPNNILTWTRATDLNTPSKLVKYTSVQVVAGSSATAGKVYVMISTIDDLATDPQEWVIYSHTLVTTLSVYYPNHRLAAGDRLAVTNLNPRTLPQKIYNYMTRRGGLYVGAEGLTENFFRFNPDVDMSEFFFTSLTNNYIVKNIAEAQLYGFDTLKKNQVVLVPKSLNFGVSSLVVANAYPSPPPFNISPAQAMFGPSLDDESYQTLTSVYNTAAVLNRELTTNSRYIELQYTGPLADLSDSYFGILPPYNSDDFLTSLELTSTAGWAIPVGNLYGTASIIADGSYETMDATFNTATIINKSIKNANYAVFEYTNALVQSMEIVFGIIDQTTYESAVGVSADWAATYSQISRNENILFRINTPTQFEYAINGVTTTEAVPAISSMNMGGKVLIVVAKVSATLINIGVTYLDADDTTILYERTLEITVVDADTWFMSDKKFYMSSNSNTLTVKSIYSNQYIPQTPPGFVLPDATLAHIDSLQTEDNWSNLINLTKREGFLIQLDFITGTGTAFENGTSQAMVAATTLMNSKLNTNGYIQMAFTQLGNNITYEIVVVTNTGDVIGSYSRTMAVTDGVAWLNDTNKRYYITTNNTLHTYRATPTVHSYEGSIVTTDFINVGDPGYEVYTSDFTNIVPRRSMVVGAIPAPPNPVPRITNATTAIISLTGQENDSLNKYYQLETLDDIKAMGIRLSENNLIMPLCNFTVEVPSRRFKIPVRMRRLLRRVTQMSGL